jgi:hypothetical protein
MLIRITRKHRRAPLLLALLLQLACAALSRPVSASPVEGDFHERTVQSKEFAGERQLLVWLPNSYADNPTKRYPVLYALQGENLFDPARAAGGDEWAVDELLVREPTGIAEWIVVGIVSAPNAVREYATPGSRGDAQGETFLRFMIHEVKPFVDKTWRTLPDAAHSFVLGMGMSALTAVYATWVYTDFFAGAIAFELPDVDTSVVLWPSQPPAQPSPWLWLEQRSSKRSRNSNGSLFADLKRHGNVHLLVAGPTSSHPARLAAALRAIPLPPATLSPEVQSEGAPAPE